MNIDVRSSFARQAAAADLWMELTGRKQAAAAEIAHEKLAAMADAKEEKPAPKLRVPVGAGAALGGAAGAGAGAGLAHLVGPTARHSPPAALGHLSKELATFKPIPKGRAALGAGIIGAGAGAAAGLGLGVQRLRKHFARKEGSGLSTLQKRLLGGAAMGAGMGAVGGAYHYSQARPGKGGKSKQELVQELELQRLKGLFEHKGRSSRAARGLKDRYREMVREHTQKAKKSPGRAALVGALPYAAGGALFGAMVAPRFLR